MGLSVKEKAEWVYRIILTGLITFASSEFKQLTEQVRMSTLNDAKQDVRIENIRAEQIRLNDALQFNKNKADADYSDLSTRIYENSDKINQYFFQQR